MTTSARAFHSRVPPLPSLQPCPHEIAACDWVPLSLFLSQPRFLASPLYACVYDLCRDALPENEGKARPVTAIMGTQLELGFKPGAAWLYHTSEWHHEKHGGKGEGENGLEEGKGAKKGAGNLERGQDEEGFASLREDKTLLERK